MIEMRVRTRTSKDELDLMTGKLPAASHIHALLTGAATVFKPDGTLLCVYLPGALAADVDAPGVYDILTSLSNQTTDNRGYASGTQRKKDGPASRTRTAPVASAIVGSFDTLREKKYCRLTAWTAQNLDQWNALHPLLRSVAREMRDKVPGRWAAQQHQADLTDPAWVVPGTPFTTVTVNNSYSTGMHTDKGDLHEGFSTIACLRRGTYSGGWLNFPEYRLGVDLRHGDLILMDSHEWHANTQMVCACGRKMMGQCFTCGAERISVVAYFRTKMPGCGTPEQELAKAQEAYDRQNENKVARAAGTPA